MRCPAVAFVLLGVLYKVGQMRHGLFWDSTF